MEPAMDFEWDAANIDHIADHDVTPDEAEAAIRDPKRLGAPAYDQAGERREALVGATGAGRVLVVFTQRQGKIRVVTAWPASGRAARRYLTGGAS